MDQILLTGIPTGNTVPKYGGTVIILLYTLTFNFKLVFIRIITYFYVILAIFKICLLIQLCR